MRNHCSVSPRETRPPVAEAENGSPFSFAVASAEELDFCGDAEQGELFRQSLARLEAAGCRRQTIAFGPFRETASLLYEGPWVAERLAFVETFFADHPRDVYPVTRAIIEQGANYRAVDVFCAPTSARGRFGRPACKSSSMPTS